ncbi:DUF3592 domain-containing protein [Acidobacteriia bacterium AH_259_A11_L15]|nr:DUF3592 domain-containing protein [Acidobacteriia bacterium AH_259_A11_L15]
MDLSQPDASPRKHKKKRKKSPLLWVVGGVALVAVLLGLVRYEEDREYRANSTKDWLKTKGRIIKSSYQHQLGVGELADMYIPDVTYEYYVGGNVYLSRGPSGRGGRVYLYETTFSSRQEVKEFLKQFPPGKILVVYYSPEAPWESVLIPGMPPSKRWRYWLRHTLVGLAAAIIVIGIYFAFFGILRFWGVRVRP